MSFVKRKAAKDRQNENVLVFEPLKASPTLPLELCSKIKIYKNRSRFISEIWS